jgi:hypothetical protein
MPISAVSSVSASASAPTPATKTIKQKRSFGDKLKEFSSNALHAIRQVSSAVLIHTDQDSTIEELFDSDDSTTDYIDAIKKEAQYLRALAKSKQSRTKSANPRNTNPASPMNRAEVSNDATMISQAGKLSPTTDTPYTVNGTFTGPNSVKSPESSTISPNANGNANLSDSSEQDDSMLGRKLWEERRQRWLTPTMPKETYVKRKQTRTLARLSDQGNEVYVNVYRNLVVDGRPLKRGINLTEGIKVIYSGWENDRMFERVANGGAP